ncbi:ras-related protein Rab-43 isoform X2 [Egretta garzetta]|uniref:ras-related protein Rab-43 isoform X2 n=1 Tax=Egretta garzetta TaxID=188379 RepID=UPI00163C43B4|nr:ras-related protein Rab-43 isoform X2 [Egretta garzetta]
MKMQLQIWDTAGQERFRTITQSYYRSANGAILAYDISKRGSFLSIPRWIEDVRKYAGSNIVQLLIDFAGSEAQLLWSCSHGKDQRPQKFHHIKPTFFGKLEHPHTSAYGGFWKDFRAIWVRQFSARSSASQPQCF